MDIILFAGIYASWLGTVIGTYRIDTKIKNLLINRKANLDNVSKKLPMIANALSVLIILIAIRLIIMWFAGGDIFGWFVVLTMIQALDWHCEWLWLQKLTPTKAEDWIAC